MEIVLNGWRRAVVTHRHAVEVIDAKTGMLVKTRTALDWSSSSEARGKLNGVALNGDFDAYFRFERAELRNWLMVSAKEDPAAILRLLSEVQAEALIYLAQKSD